MERSHRETKDLQWFGYEGPLRPTPLPEHLTREFSSLCQQTPLWRRNLTHLCLHRLTTPSKMSSSNSSQNQYHDFSQLLMTFTRLVHTTTTSHLHTTSLLLLHNITSTSLLLFTTNTPRSTYYKHSTPLQIIYTTTRLYTQIYNTS